MTIEQLIHELQKLDPQRRVNIVDGFRQKNSDGSETTNFSVSAVEAVLELQNGCVGIVTRAGLDIGQEID